MEKSGGWNPSLLKVDWNGIVETRVAEQQLLFDFQTALG